MNENYHKEKFYEICSKLRKAVIQMCAANNTYLVQF